MPFFDCCCLPFCDCCCCFELPPFADGLAVVDAVVVVVVVVDVVDDDEVAGAAVVAVALVAATVAVDDDVAAAPVDAVLGAGGATGCGVAANISARARTAPCNDSSASRIPKERPDRRRRTCSAPINDRS